MKDIASKIFKIIQNDPDLLEKFAETLGLTEDELEREMTDYRISQVTKKNSFIEYNKNLTEKFTADRF